TLLTPPVSAFPLADGTAAAARLRQGFNHVILRCRCRRRHPGPIPYSRASTAAQLRNPGLPRRRRRSICICSSRRSCGFDEYLHLCALEVQWMCLVPLQDLGPVTLPILRPIYEPRNRLYTQEIWSKICEMQH
ncbi:unnamed protein product, partial [Urochloa humidicola]